MTERITLLKIVLLWNMTINNSNQFNHICLWKKGGRFYFFFHFFFLNEFKLSLRLIFVILGNTSYFLQSIFTIHTVIYTISHYKVTFKISCKTLLRLVSWPINNLRDLQSVQSTTYLTCNMTILTTYLTLNLTNEYLKWHVFWPINNLCDL